MLRAVHSVLLSEEDTDTGIIISSCSSTTDSWHNSLDRPHKASTSILASQSRTEPQGLK